MFSVDALIIFSALIIRVLNSDEVLPTTPPQPMGDTAEETQHAICKIITKEVQTSANATVKRQLKGVCTSNQLERKFKQLERKLLLELQHIKALLTGDRSPTVRTTDEYEDYFNYGEKSLDSQKVEESVVSITEVITRDSSWARTEIDQLNNTMYTIKGENVYTYYWGVPQIRFILSRTGIHMRSSDFYVLGHQLCIQMYPHHLDSNYLGVQLRPSSNFAKKHRFAILDQLELDSSKDIKSQTLGGASSYEGVYRVPYAKLEERHYLHNNTLILKLTVYLNS